MTIKNNLLLGGDLSDYTPPDGAVDSLGIKYSGLFWGNGYGDGRFVAGVDAGQSAGSV